LPRAAKSALLFYKSMKINEKLFYIYLKMFDKIYLDNEYSF